MEKLWKLERGRAVRRGISEQFIGLCRANVRLSFSEGKFSALCGVGGESGGFKRGNTTKFLYSP